MTLVHMYTHFYMYERLQNIVFHKVFETIHLFFELFYTSFEYCMLIVCRNV